MYIAPIVLAPYVMLAKWASFWGRPVAKPVAEPPIQVPPEAGDGNTSPIALSPPARRRPRASKKINGGSHSKKRVVSHAKKRPALARGRR
jgi:hypothetical protein